MAAAKEARLTDLIPRIRADLHAAEVPFILGQIRGMDYAFREVVRTAQYDVDALGIGAYLVETDDLTMVEGLHFDTPAHLALGRRFATAMIGLQSTVEGDADGDGAVDVGDLNAIRNNFGAWGRGRDARRANRVGRIEHGAQPLGRRWCPACARAGGAYALGRRGSGLRSDNATYRPPAPVFPLGEAVTSLARSRCAALPTGHRA